MAAYAFHDMKDSVERVVEHCLGLLRKFEGVMPSDDRPTSVLRACLDKTGPFPPSVPQLGGAPLAGVARRLVERLVDMLCQNLPSASVVCKTLAVVVALGLLARTYGDVQHPRAMIQPVRLAQALEPVWASGNARLRRRSRVLCRVADLLGLGSGVVGSILRGRWAPDLPEESFEPAASRFLALVGEARLLGGGVVGRNPLPSDAWEHVSGAGVRHSPSLGWYMQVEVDRLPVGPASVKTRVAVQVPADEIVPKEPNSPLHVPLRFYRVCLGAGEDVVVSPDLVAHLSARVAFRPRTGELLALLRGKALEWFRRYGVADDYAALLMPGSLALAFRGSLPEVAARSVMGAAEVPGEGGG